MTSPLSSERVALRPELVEIIRGTEVVFAGFPHGIQDLLVQAAIVSGPLGDRAFYINGSVNGSNSGGPILSLASGDVIGIVTQRRFLGAADLEQMARRAAELEAYSQQMAGQGSVQIMGIDFGQFARLMASSSRLLRTVVEANANSGIGVGFSIRAVAEACTALGSTRSDAFTRREAGGGRNVFSVHCVGR